MAADSRLNDLARGFARLRERPLPSRIGLGLLTALIGAAAFYALAAVIDDCRAFAVFFLLAQIAGLGGGLAAAATSALVSTLIVHLAGAPFAEVWVGAALLFATAALAGFAGDMLGAAESERRRAEAARADGPARTFESIAAALTHDVTQPLSAAVAYLQAVRRLLAIEGGGRGPAVSSTVDKAIAQLTRAGRLVGRLREFLAHGPPRLAAVSVHAVLLEAVGPHRLGEGPALRLDARRDLILADPARIEQLLGEIVGAATSAIRRATDQPTIATSSNEQVLTLTLVLGALDAEASEGRAGDLAMWRAIVEAHHGGFRTEPAQDGALTVNVSFPLAARGG